MKLNQWLMIGLALLSAVFLGVLGYTYFPQPRSEKTIEFTFINPQAHMGDLPSDLPRYLLEEKRVLKLAYPSAMWLGDQQFLSLSIPPKTDAAQPSSQADKNLTKYKTHLEARLDQDFMYITPGKTVIEAIQPSKPAQFLWKMSAAASGKSSGNLWLFVNIADIQNGSAWQLTRFALPIEIEIKDIIGLPLALARSFMVIVLTLTITAWLILFFFSQRKPGKARML